ncbi:MAG: phage tail protein [Hellea sp.]|nr:phage tail protein [Hellea sp.]
MTFRKLLLSAVLIGGTSIATSTVSSAQESYIGEIRTLPYNFCPRGTASAEGQLLPISQYSALFSLYGTTFGGDGRTTFALPDMRGRVAFGYGQAPGLSNYSWGQKGGVETVTLTTNEIPPHNHRSGIQTYDDAANSTTPRKNSFGIATGNTYVSNEDAPSGQFMHSDTVLVENAGGGQSHENRQPYIALRYCVVTSGIFPSRS